jgi:TolB-like protein
MRVAAILLSILLAFSAAAETLEDAIATLAKKISSSAEEQKKRKIAVLPFDEAAGRKTVLATYIPETLVTNLFQLGRYEIVERQLLDKVIGELKKQNREGAFDPKTAAKVGQIAGVEAIVTGTITEFPDYIGINCRIIDTTTASVFGAAGARFAKDANLRAMLAGETQADPPKQAGSPKSERPSYTNQRARIEIESAERKANVVSLSIVVESRSSDEFYFGTGAVSMLDDNGDRWGCTFEDGYDVASFELHPRTRHKLHLSCRPNGDANGTTFTLLGAGGDLRAIEDIVPIRKQ